MATIKGVNPIDGNIKGNNLTSGKFNYDKKYVTYQDLATMESKIESEIPTKLSELEQDPLHRTVTDEDIEKWNNPESYIELFYVTFNETITQADKTALEIYEAKEQGLYPVGVYYYNNEYYVTPFVDMNRTYAIAQLILGTDINYIQVDNSKTATQNIINLATTNTSNLTNYYTKTQSDYKYDAKYYDASYLFDNAEQETPITDNHYNELSQAITNKTRIVLLQGNEQYDALGRINDGNNLTVTITVGSTDSYNHVTYANDIVALFEVNGITREVTLTVGNTNGADFAEDLDDLSTLVQNKVDILDLETDYYDKDTTNTFQGVLLPDFDKMRPIKIIEYDCSDNKYHKLFNIANTFATLDDVKGECAFRITTTITNSTTSSCDVVFSLRTGDSASPYMVVRNNPGRSVGGVASSGTRYLRWLTPKTVVGGADYSLEFSCYNSTTRHQKIEIFKSSNNISWYNTLTLTDYDSTTQAKGEVTTSTTNAITIIPTATMTVSTAQVANYINSYLPKYISGTLPTAGEAILAQQFVFKNGGKFYPSSNKLTAIDVGCGIQLCSNNVALNSNVASTALRQKYNNGSLTNIPHNTLVAGNECYFRCTMNANGEIYSDDYVDTQMSPGYTWYYIGNATSDSAINTDTTQSFFITLDANGNITHINGKKITQKFEEVSIISTSGTSCDDYIDTAVYFFATANAPSGLPAGTSGWLQIFKGSTADYIKQIYYRVSNNDIHVRTYYNSSWSSWQKVTLT